LSHFKCETKPRHYSSLILGRRFSVGRDIPSRYGH
jgi:hypothetical protein